MCKKATPVIGLVLLSTVTWSAPAPEARRILEETGVRGGLVVHVGCGDGRLTAALRASDSYLVHGLDTEATNVARARAHIGSVGLYGPVSVERFDGRRLPYADNLVNLLVALDPGELPVEEILRVLVPRGVAYLKRDGRWTRTVKPRPEEIDEWTHFLHDGSNNAVARDRRVGPPRRLQWTARPRWCRSHEFVSSFCAMVTAGGRVFYVLDEGLPGVTDERLPERWALFGRDAFNGVLLWKRPLPEWRGEEWKNSSMRGRPPGVPRRIVAGGDRLYATLSHRAPLAVLDAATGRTLRTIQGTGGTQEILRSGRTLVLRVAALEPRGGRAGGSIVAVDAEGGRILWRAGADRFLAQSLAAASGRVVYNTGGETVCLDLADGRELWRHASGRPAGKRPGERTVLIHRDLVLEGDRAGIVARSLESGDILWSTAGKGGAMRPHDLFVIDGRAWHAAPGGIAGYDLKTGKPATVIDPSAVQSRGHHLRCYRGKATERFIITQFRGAEFVSLSGDSHSGSDWLRGPCRHGVMPANGMLYVPPHQCFCYTGAMMTGLNACGTASDDALRVTGASSRVPRLERGPAHDGVADAPPATDREAWPTYRHDAGRLGATPSKVPPEVGVLWRAGFGGRVTPPVAAAGRVLVSEVDAHRIHALDPRSGQPLWQFTAGGRIDSPPTVYRGRVLFGCADGRVYCLRATDGELAWRFRAAPEERLIGSLGQLESAWPVHGSVLVLDGTAYVTAGRSTFLDGGIHVFGLDPLTGEVRHQARLDTLKIGVANATTKKPFLPAFHIEGARSDILVSDGTHLYLGQIKMDARLVEQPTPLVSVDNEKDRTVGLDISRAPYVHPDVFKKGYDDYAVDGVKRGPMGTRRVGRHVFSTGGLLDDSWFHRTFWMYAETWPGFQIANLAPKAGQILVVDRTTTYGVQAYPSRWKLSPKFVPGDRGYLLVADDSDNEPVLDHRTAHRDKGMGFTRAAPPRWHRWLPVRIRAMVATGETLFAMGPPDVIDPEDPMASFEGRRGAVLLSIAKGDGQIVAEKKLDVAPVFDGLIAAHGRLYLSTTGDEVLCLGDR